MARYNNKKLQTQRNFQSIWHSQPEYIGTLLKEDQLIREYIIGTMKAKGWKLSEIIIKRKVKQIHIAFQIQNKIVKERKRWTKNRLKNRINTRGAASMHSKRTHASLAVRTKLRRMALKKRFLFFQLYLMITELRKMYPNNQITFYVQKTKPLQFNANLINSWIIENIKKKKSYKRLLNRVVSKFKKAQKTNVPSKPINLQSSYWSLPPQAVTAGGRSSLAERNQGFLLEKKDDKKSFLSWVTGNLIYLYNVQKLISQSQIKLSDTNSMDRLNSFAAKGANLPYGQTKTESKKLDVASLPQSTSTKRLKAVQNSMVFAPIWWRLRKKYGWIQTSSRRIDLRKKSFRSKQNGFAAFGANFRPKAEMRESRRGEPYVSLLKKRLTAFRPVGQKAELSTLSLEHTPGYSVRSTSSLINKNRFAAFGANLPGGQTRLKSASTRLMSSMTKKQLMNLPPSAPIFGQRPKSAHRESAVGVSPNFNGLTSNELVELVWFAAKGANLPVGQTNLEHRSFGSLQSSLATAQTFGKAELSSLVGPDSTGRAHLARTAGGRSVPINQELRSTWKLMRKIYKGSSLKKRRKKIGNAKQHLKGVLKHRKEFNEDTLLLLNYYKFKYLLSLQSSHLNLDQPMALAGGKTKNFLWQGVKFVNFIQQHPALLDHTIKCLASLTPTNEFAQRANCLPSQIDYLTRAWVGFFDYIYHYENSLLKWQGIKILLSGRVGYQKMGRAKKYSRYWGSLKNSSARLPLQYSYSQLYTRYGVVGVKVYVR